MYIFCAYYHLAQPYLFLGVIVVVVDVKILWLTYGTSHGTGNDSCHYFITLDFI